MQLIEMLKTLPLLHKEFDGLEETKLRVIQPIYFGDYEYSVSVQASQHHYCHPRETLDLKYYSHFEVMLNVPQVDIPITWEDFNYCGDYVYGYVPIVAIERLLEDLDKKYKMIRKH